LPSLYSVFFLLNEGSGSEVYAITAQIFKGTTIGGMLVILSAGI